MHLHQDANPALRAQPEVAGGERRQKIAAIGRLRKQQGADRCQQVAAEIQALNASLERRVDERTSQLQAAKDTVEHERGTLEDVVKAFGTDNGKKQHLIKFDPSDTIEAIDKAGAEEASAEILTSRSRVRRSCCEHFFFEAEGCREPVMRRMRSRCNSSRRKAGSASRRAAAFSR